MCRDLFLNTRWDTEQHEYALSRRNRVRVCPEALMLHETPILDYIYGPK